MQPYPHRLVAPIWARSGHSQTILGHFLPSPGRAIGVDAGDRRLEVELPDGDRLVGYESQPTGAPSGVRAHLFHGLSGDVNAEYMRRSASALRAAGHQVWSFNHRGAGEGAGLATGIYHSGRSDDLGRVLAESRRQRPDQLQLVVGFSLSGNAALKFAADHASGRSPECALPAPDGILAINPPCDLEHTSLRIQRGFNRFYEARFVRRLRRAIALRPGAPRVPRHARLWDVDELVTAPLGGFRDARDYYARCSTIDRLTEIRIPTVVLTAGDDPFVDAARIAAAPRAGSVHLHVEARGGHVGYLEAPGPARCAPGRWLDGALVHFTQQLREAAHQPDAAASF